MKPELETIKYPDITSVRTNHPLIFDPFKEIVKLQGLDVCFVTNNFWKAYREAYELGKVEMPTTTPNQQPLTQTQGQGETKETHSHLHLHLHTNYVVDRPRRRKSITDIPYICEAKGCTNTATNQATFSNGITRIFCDAHTQDSLNAHPVVHPLKKVNNCNTLNGQEKQERNSSFDNSNGKEGVRRNRISKSLKRINELKRNGRKALKCW